MKQNIIKDKSYKFSLDTINLVRKFSRNSESYIISKQLLRSATSVGANVEEAVSGFSRNDFTFKMNLALKECSESSYWLRLVKDSNILNSCDLDKAIQDCEEIRKILTSIVKTAQENSR